MTYVQHHCQYQDTERCNLNPAAHVSATCKAPKTDSESCLDKSNKITSCPCEPNAEFCHM